MVTLADVETVATKWLGDTDPAPLRAILCAYAAHRWLAGDPVWLGLVGGSGVGKTERVMALASSPKVTLASSITSEGALLSASPRRDRTKEATGGLLRQLGLDGFLVLKDLTTLLSMNYERQAAVFAAFREIYDGRWSRSVGTDGAKQIEWSGRIGLVFGCTTELDRRRAFLSTMGERFLLIRLAPDDSSVDSALGNIGREPEMRREMAEVVRALLETDHPTNGPHLLTDDVRARLHALSILATQARSPVARDYQGQIELVLDRESPNRFVKQLAGMWQAAGLIGLDTEQAERLIARTAMDSIPQLRRQALEMVYMADGHLTTAEVAERIARPTRTVHRALEDLEAHALVSRSVAGKAHVWFAPSRTVGLFKDGGVLVPLITPLHRGENIYRDVKEDGTRAFDENWSDDDGRW